MKRFYPDHRRPSSPRGFYYDSNHTYADIKTMLQMPDSVKYANIPEGRDFFTHLQEHVVQAPGAHRMYTPGTKDYYLLEGLRVDFMNHKQRFHLCVYMLHSGYGPNLLAAIFIEDRRYDHKAHSQVSNIIEMIEAAAGRPRWRRPYWRLMEGTRREQSFMDYPRGHTRPYTGKPQLKRTGSPRKPAWWFD